MSALVRGRLAAQRRMTSTATVRRKNGKAAQSPDGKRGWLWLTTYTGLPVRISGSTRGASASTGESIEPVTFERAVRVAHVPWDTANLQDGDLIEVTSGDCDGLVFRIVESDFQDQATARRVRVEAVDRPEEW